MLCNPLGCAAAQRDPHRLEKWANGSPLQFIQVLCKLHTWGGITPLSPPKYRLGTYWLEISFAERRLEALVKTKLTVSQQCALAVTMNSATGQNLCFPMLNIAGNSSI